MKITMYELLGMIKDSKAPKIIKYEDYIYSWDSDYQDYVCDDLFLLDFTSISEDLQEYLQCTLEILEEEKKIPEKLDYCEEHLFDNNKTSYLSMEERRLLDSNFKELGNKLNEIIDYLKSKGE